MHVNFTRQKFYGLTLNTKEYNTLTYVLMSNYYIANKTIFAITKYDNKAEDCQ